MRRMIRAGLRLSIPLALAFALGVAAKRKEPAPAPSASCHATAAAAEGGAEACSSIPPSRASLRASKADLPHTIPMVNLP